ncbi:tetratricopeptide repeat protein [Changchengzhania lutea]|uniref:tetratricopeptide repeat protein n=1 Tax=Changchengzhania lutea TaxID=2049305 RepID=UPI00115EA86D|nr:tetratricopeptide repeat protein [Changchengzhania lutea]
MKKQLIIAVALSISAFSFAQKKELKTAEKAIKSSNYSEAKASLNQAEAMMGSMDDKLKSKFYYLKAQALYANGAGSNDEVDMALEMLDKAKGEYSSEVAELKRTMVGNFLTKGNASYESKDFSVASKYFERAYRAKESDTLFLYYAASTAVSVQEYDRALKLYEELKDLGYTGIEMQYFATNVETQEEESFNDKNMRDLSVKAKSHIKPVERMSDSYKPEIVKNIALIYVSQGDNEKALTAMKDARAESPDDVNLILSEANVHYKMGNKEEFKSLLEMATEKDPMNPELQYNLGVIASESEQLEESMAYYKKAIELDPDYVNAYINISALILGKEQPMIEEMNNLGSSAADNKRYDELKDARQDLYKEAVPYLTKALEIDANNFSAATTLMNIYSILGETDKYKAMKVRVDALKGEE